MSQLFEISGNDIALLDDGELRTLIGLLCEADYRQAGLPTTGIRWGGNQDAKDGGIDVFVDSAGVTPPKTSFIPRAITGFQVKKSDRSRSEILAEMRPKKVLRDVIKKLIKTKGAYIIISSGASTTEPALNDRISAMREAVSDQQGHDDLVVNFLDRGIIATWVRNHPSLALRVRHKIGRPLKGWHSYDNWAKSPGGIEEEYLLDNRLRLHDRTTSNNDGMSIKDGLSRLQALLSKPRTCVRLAGLSGVGKTRLVQALFDSRINQPALNPAEVFYTDMSEGPTPDPLEMAEQLIAGRTQGVLIVDNCPPELHNKLTKICSAQQSPISLLTVEYDVRDDLPNETSVFRLEPASEETIEKLITKRSPHINQVDAHTIAEFSGGNARLAIALVNTIKAGDTLSSFRDEELFERLFWQRNKTDNSLLISAESCALVYSFEGTDVISDTSELKLLAALANKPVADLYRDISALKDRDLLQERSVWRAILPHAVANRLAKRAFKTIPKTSIVHTFINSGSERLIKSLTRRMSYLHDSEQVAEIVNDWLTPDGWLGKDIHNLSKFGMDVLNNIAPVSQPKVLDSIELAVRNHGEFSSAENPNFEKFSELLRKLAYNPDFFPRCIDLLCLFAKSEGEQSKTGVSDRIKSLFFLYLSGTKAPLEMRVKVVEALISSDDPFLQELGFKCLDAALEAWHFSSSYDFGFGAWPRDHGYEPETHDEAVRWYEAFIKICVQIGTETGPKSERVRHILASNFRGLWTKGGIYEPLKSASTKISISRPWNEGWIAVRGVISYDGKQLAADVLEALNELEQMLKPNNLLEQARTFAFSEQNGGLYLEDALGDEGNPVNGWERAEKTTRKIGAQVAQDAHVFQAILPDLVSIDGRRLFGFGQGLADGAVDLESLWTMLTSQFKATDPEKREARVLTGFLSVCADNQPNLYNQILDEALEDEVIAEWFPILQATKVIDSRCVDRLNKSLDIGKASAYSYQYLGWGHAHEPISDDDLSRLIDKIILKEGGIDIALEILLMRFHGKEKPSIPKSASLVSVAQKTLLLVDFSREERKRHDGGYRLAEIIDKLLIGNGARQVAAEICRNLAQAVISGDAYAFDYPALLKSLAALAPLEFLDVFVGQSQGKSYRLQSLFYNDFESRENPLNVISDSDILAWCDISPNDRYPAIASSISGFSPGQNGETLEWKKIVYSIFEKVPNLDEVLDEFASSIKPNGWSGSLAEILQKRLILFEALFVHENVQISSWAKRSFDRLTNLVRNQRDMEENENRNRNESFE